jgi:hypothetical protein
MGEIASSLAAALSQPPKHIFVCIVSFIVLAVALSAGSNPPEA